MNAVMHMRAQTELATIYEISKILTSSLDVSKTCREALNVLANNMGYRRCMIIVDDEDGELHLLAAVGLSPEEYDAGHYRPGEGIIGKVYSNGMPAVVHDLAAEVEKILTHRLLFTAARVASADGQWEKRLASFVDGINGESTTAVVCPVPF